MLQLLCLHLPHYALHFPTYRCTNNHSQTHPSLNVIMVFTTTKCSVCHNTGYLNNACARCESGKVKQKCRECWGFGWKYYGNQKATCLECDGHGEVYGNCPYCKGSGVVTTEEVCPYCNRDETKGKGRRWLKGLLGFGSG